MNKVEHVENKTKGQVEIIEQPIVLLDDILKQWKELIGSEYQGYRNHVYRMVHICFAIRDCNDEEREKIIIAGAFHDIGIWIENTVDYIPPSLLAVTAYLSSRNLEHWIDEISLMITEHHKIRSYKDQKYPLVEVFRQGDLVDFSFGLIRFGVEEAHIKLLKEKFPNSNFHKNLANRAIRWIVKHPLRPLPMMKW